MVKTYVTFLACAAVLGGVVSAVVFGLTKDPELSQSTKYELMKSYALVNEFSLRLERSYTPEQRGIIKDLNDMLVKRSAAQSKAAGECGVKFDLTFDKDEPVCRKKEVPVKK